MRKIWSSLGENNPGPRRGKGARKLLRTVTPTGVERVLAEDEVIVSKTDPTGRITYVNRVFMRIADFSERELLGAPHSIVRHPDMPRCVFKFLWDTLQAKKEIFAYVVNMTKYGDHYWVFAHATPSLSDSGEIVGYHSNRRAPKRQVIDEVFAPLYRALLAEEQKHADRKVGMERSYAMLLDVLKEKGMDYDELVFSL